MRVLWSLVVLCLVAVSGVERTGERRGDGGDGVDAVLAAGSPELSSRVGTHPTATRAGEAERAVRGLPLAIVVDRFALAPRGDVAFVERAAPPATVVIAAILVGSARGPPIG